MVFIAFHGTVGPLFAALVSIYISFTRRPFLSSDFVLPRSTTGSRGECNGDRNHCDSLMAPSKWSRNPITTSAKRSPLRDRRHREPIRVRVKFLRVAAVYFEFSGHGSESKK